MEHWKEAMLNESYKDKRFYYSGNDMVYMCLHEVHNASTATGGWKIFKFTYVDSIVTRIELLIGAADDRATLGWG